MTIEFDFNRVINKAIQQEIELRAKEQVEDVIAERFSKDIAPSGNIRPVRVWQEKGFSSGTLHKVAIVDGFDVWATAFHVTEGHILGEQLEPDYGQCFVLDRKDPNNAQRPDVHFFCKSQDALQKFKDACPSPEEAAIEFAIQRGSFFERPDQPNVGIVSGYPHGVINGLPQTRNIRPFFSDAPDLTELLWFYCDALVVGGMSGGIVKSNRSESSKGVLVATSYMERQDYCLVQLFHNEMNIEVPLR